MNELYSKAELLDLTGAATVPGQQRWLDERGIPYRAEFIGNTTRRRLIVSRVHVRDWIAGHKTQSGGGFNWASVR